MDTQVQNGQAVLEYEHESFTVSNFSDEDPIEIDALVLYRFVSGTSPSRLIVVEPISMITIPPRADDGDGGTITYTGKIDAKMTVEIENR